MPDWILMLELQVFIKSMLSYCHPCLSLVVASTLVLNDFSGHASIVEADMQIRPYYFALVGSEPPVLLKSVGRVFWSSTLESTRYVVDDWRGGSG